MFEKVRFWGWRAVELTAMAVVFCVLLHILLGDGGGSFITAVAANAAAFAVQVPPGTLVGLGLLALAYCWAGRARG